MEEFKYLELTMQSNGQRTREVKKRGQAGWLKDSSMNEREDLQHSSKFCYDVWLGHGGADRKTGGRAGDKERWRIETENIRQRMLNM